MRMIASNFTVGRTTLPFLLLLLATAAWVSGVHGKDKRGHDNHVHDGNCNHDHDNHGHGNGHPSSFEENTIKFHQEGYVGLLQGRKEHILKPEKKKEKTDLNAPTKPPPPLDFGRLDLRVGHIINATKHPNADSLYVELIDVGDGDGPRTVVSGLANHVPLEKMADRTCILLCNLKPSKLRGVVSTGMVMCAISKDRKTVEILQPPPGSLPGDIVILEDRPERNPDKVLSSKVFEEIAKDLKTDAELQATYKGIHWYVQDWRYEHFTIGTISADTLINSTIY